MAILPVIEAPDPRLKVTCAPLDAVDAEMAKLMDDMLETMYAAPGIGLAAPQVGVHKRIIVLDPANEGEPPAPLMLANPKVLWASEDTKVFDEGCLSVPDIYAPVERPARIRVGYLDRDNQPQEVEATGLLAVILQHEMDHLDGILFVDHLSALKRTMILKKLRKAKRLAS